MKRGIVCIGFILVLFSLNCVMGQGNETFDPEDARTWEQAISDELSAVIQEDLYTQYSVEDYREIIEKRWKDFNEKIKNDFIETYLEKLGHKVKVEGLGDERLDLKDGILSDEAGAKFNFKNPPAGLVGISYDSKKGFIYDFGEGNFAELQKGMIEIDENGDKVVVGLEGEENKELNDFIWNGKGNLRLYQGHYWLAEWAEISKGDVTYRAATNGAKYPSLVKPISETRALLINAEGVSPRGVIKDNLLASKEGNPAHTLAVFDDLPIEPSEKRFARMGTDNLKMVGDNIAVHISESFDTPFKSVVLDGTNLDINDKQLFVDENGNLKVPRSIEVISHNLLKIENLKDPNGNVWKNENNGDSLFSQIQGYVQVGKSNVYGEGREGGSAGARKFSTGKSPAKLQLNLPEETKRAIEAASTYEEKLEILRKSPKSLTMSFLDRFKSSVMIEKMQKGVEGKTAETESVMKNAAASAVLASIGKDKPVRSFLRDFSSGLGHSSVIDTAFETSSLLLTKRDFGKVVSQIGKTEIYNRGDLIRYSTTVSGSGEVSVIGSETQGEVPVTRKLTDDYIVEMVQKYPLLVKEVPSLYQPLYDQQQQRLAEQRNEDNSP